MNIHELAAEISRACARASLAELPVEQVVAILKSQIELEEIQEVRRQQNERFYYGS